MSQISLQVSFLHGVKLLLEEISGQTLNHSAGLILSLKFKYTVLFTKHEGEAGTIRLVPYCHPKCSPLLIPKFIQQHP